MENSFFDSVSSLEQVLEHIKFDFSENMKVFSIVICVLVVQVSGSFYDELQGAMHSVQHGFGKLLSDVVFDVSDTVHCTISAVEHVLTLNGLIKNKSTYGHKCRDGPLPPIDYRYSDDPLENFLKTRDALEGKRYVKATPKEIHHSISKVNTTLIDAFDNHDGRQKIESISKVLKDETEQLTKVSNMLRQELHSISRNVNSELKKFDNNLGTNWSELGEKNNPNFAVRQNRGQAYVSPVREETSQKTNENTKSNEPSNQENSFNDAKLEFEHLRDVAKQNTPSSQFPKTFKDVAKSIRESSNLNYNGDSIKKHDSGSIFNVDNSRFDQLSPFYDPEASTNDGHKAVDDALSIIRDSERNDQIMEMLKQSHAGSDVFSAKNVFNF